MNKEMGDKEVLVVSLLFVGLVYLAGGFFSAFLSLPYLRWYLQYSVAIPLQLWVGWPFVFASLIFLVAWGSELRSYRLLLRSRLPLLSASWMVRDATYWRNFVSFIEGRRKALGNELAGQMLAVANYRWRLAAKGEAERDFIEHRVAWEAGADPDIVRLALRYAASFDQEARIVPLLPGLPTAVAVLVGLAAALSVITSALTSNSILASLGVFALVVSTLSVGYVILALLSYRLRQARRVSAEVKAILPRITKIKEQVEKVYDPLERHAKALTEQGTPYLEAFVKHVDAELGTHRDLAFEPTAEVYSTRPNPISLDWAQTLAKRLIEDHARLAEEYRNLTLG